MTFGEVIGAEPAVLVGNLAIVNGRISVAGYLAMAARAEAQLVPKLTRAKST